MPITTNYRPTSKSPPHRRLNAHKDRKHKPVQLVLPLRIDKAASSTNAAVQKTMRTKWMLLGLNARQALADGPLPKKKVDTARRRPPFTAPIFGELHTDIAIRMQTYRVRNYRNKVVLPQTLWDELDPRNSKYMLANNIASRKQFSAIADTVLRPQFLMETRPLFWITLTPKQYGFAFEQACQFDVRRLQKWITQMLPGLSFVGVIEGGCFPVQHASHSRIEVSFHGHLIGWGLEEQQVEELVAQINRRYPAFVRRSPCAHFARMQPSEIIKRVFYMTKAPLKEMRFVPQLERVDLDTGEITTKGEDRTFKRPIRTGHFANMCRVMENRTLDKLAFCAGEGKPLLKDIRDRALSQYRSQEARRKAVSAIANRTGGRR